MFVEIMAGHQSWFDYKLQNLMNVDLLTHFSVGIVRHMIETHI